MKRQSTLGVREFPSLTPFRASPVAHDPHDVLRLALSENPLGASPKAMAAARAAVEQAHWYPHSDGEPLRGELAAHYGLPGHKVIVGNGVDEIILLAALATSGQSRPTVITANTFAGYAASLETAGHAVTTVPLATSAGVDLDAVCEAASRAACVVVCNPHNPTGTVLTADQVQTLVEACADAGALLILDEAYAEFADATRFGSGLPHLHRPGVVVLRTFSKAYGLAGLRCGYALGDEDLIAAMTAIRTALPYNTNRVALAAAAAALADQDHLRTVVDECTAARQALTSGLAHLGVPTLPSQTNFVLARLGDGADDAGSVIARLADRHGIHIRDMTGLGLPGWARISVPRTRDVPLLTTSLRCALAAPDASV
ncbi:histidinol-phosphate transaminase [Streptomyces spectabilis]|uniref:pyridoxal phosphate-dependent aminotransferase n=1 Tax=Streptomyces spectabilis TaxID=68270 RepID=UPI003410CF03